VTAIRTYAFRLRDLGAFTGGNAIHGGCGARPLTEECGTIVLAALGDGGRLLTNSPAWPIDGTRPSHLSRLLKGREWTAKPEIPA
jgi:sulfide:quinone oxidoreductase